MKIKKIRIDIYNWDVQFIYIQKSDKNITKFGEYNNFLDKYILEINKNIIGEFCDGALTLSHFDQRETFVIIYPTLSNKMKIINISHEIRHIVDMITHHLEIEDDESAAYLTGYISGEILT